jgi:hypothetical protein
MKFALSSLLPQEEFVNIIPNLQFKEKLSDISLKFNEAQLSAVNLKFKAPSARAVLTVPAAACASAHAPSVEAQEIQEPTMTKKRKISPKLADNIVECTMDELDELIASMDEQKSIFILQNLNICDTVESFARSVKLVLLYTVSLNYGLCNSLLLSQKYYSDSIFKSIILIFKNGVEMVLKEYESNQGLEFSGDLEKLMAVLNDLLQKNVIPAQEVITVRYMN